MVSSSQAQSSEQNSKESGLKKEPRPFWWTMSEYIWRRKEQRNLRLSLEVSRRRWVKLQGSWLMESRWLWLRAKGQSAPSCIHLAQSSSVVSRQKPQMSAPTICTPKIWKRKLPLMEARRKSQLATLSPVQCPANTPLPTLLLRLMMKGLPRQARNSKVGTVERCPQQLWTSRCFSCSWCDSVWWSSSTLMVMVLMFSWCWMRKGSGVASPPRKLAGSFMSSHIPEKFTACCSLRSCCFQQSEALGCRQSTKCTCPGQTCPTQHSLGLPGVLRNTSIFLPMATAGWSSTDTPTSISGMKCSCSPTNSCESFLEGCVSSLMVKIIFLFMYSRSDQIESMGRSCLLNCRTTSIRSSSVRQPHRHWWYPRLQNGGMWLCPMQSWYLLSRGSGSSWPSRMMKCSVPPTELKMSSLASSCDSISSPCVFLKQTRWCSPYFWRARYTGWWPQVCWLSPFLPSSIFQGRSLFHSVQLPSVTSKCRWNLSPSPHFTDSSRTVNLACMSLMARSARAKSSFWVPFLRTSRKLVRLSTSTLALHSWRKVQMPLPILGLFMRFPQILKRGASWKVNCSEMLMLSMSFSLQLIDRQYDFAWWFRKQTFSKQSSASGQILNTGCPAPAHTLTSTSTTTLAHAPVPTHVPAPTKASLANILLYTRIA